MLILNVYGYLKVLLYALSLYSLAAHAHNKFQRYSIAVLCTLLPD